MVKTFIRYPGNKSRILKQLLLLVPKEFNTYYEPFLGSGALYLALEPEKAVLNDINKDLIGVWKHVKKDPMLFLDTITMLFKENIMDKDRVSIHHNFSKLYNVLNNTRLKKLSRHSIYLFLSYYSFLGLLEKKKNMYVKHGLRILSNNPPYKDYHIKAVSVLLKTSKLYSKDYKQVVKTAKENDFVYLDPPYIHNIKDPVVYNTKGEEKILEELKKQMGILTRKGVYVMISNSDYPIVRKTFKDYFIHEIRVYRPFKKVYETELVILNYEV